VQAARGALDLEPRVHAATASARATTKPRRARGGSGAVEGRRGWVHQKWTGGRRLLWGRRAELAMGDDGEGARWVGEGARCVESTDVPSRLVVGARPFARGVAPACHAEEKAPASDRGVRQGRAAVRCAGVVRRAPGSPGLGATTRLDQSHEPRGERERSFCSPPGGEVSEPSPECVLSSSSIGLPDEERRSGGRCALLGRPAVVRRHHWGRCAQVEAPSARG
jgi:hypothetical protein